MSVQLNIALFELLGSHLFNVWRRYSMQNELTHNIFYTTSEKTHTFDKLTYWISAKFTWTRGHVSSTSHVELIIIFSPPSFTYGREVSLWYSALSVHMSLCPSFHRFNRMIGFCETLYGVYTNGGHPKIVLLNSLQWLKTKWRTSELRSRNQTSDYSFKIMKYFMVINL